MRLDLDNLKGKRVAVAVSGGKDSMALLHYFCENGAGISLLVVHCEHGIRGTESLLDAEFVKTYAKEKNLPFLFFHESCIQRAEKEKCSLETVARKFRYESFSKVLETSADVVATAHHQADNAETVLFHLARGTSLAGLTGIPDREGFVRPMISVSREEIDEYIVKHSIPYREDHTNADDIYTRNFLRHEILQKMEERIHGSISNIANFAILAREDDELLTSMAMELVNENSVKLDKRFPLFSRACLFVMKRLGFDSDYTSVHLRAIYELNDKENGKKILLPHEIEACKEYDRVVFRQKKTEWKEVPFFVQEILFGDKTIRFGEGLVFDLDKIPKTAVIRVRKAGDRFRPYKGHEKSLGDWFTDKKIPLALRESIPLVVEGNKVLIVIGYEISDEVKLTTETKRSCRIEYR